MVIGELGREDLLLMRKCEIAKLHKETAKSGSACRDLAIVHKDNNHMSEAAFKLCMALVALKLHLQGIVTVRNPIIGI